MLFDLVDSMGAATGAPPQSRTEARSECVQRVDRSTSTWPARQTSRDGVDFGSGKSSFDHGIVTRHRISYRQ
jgi:hypothetical protein